MNFENLPKSEQISKNKEKLLALEKEGKYVFHGSSEDADILEPKQAKNENAETKQMEEDGNPAIFATLFIDQAIFRSLINHGVANSRSSFGMNNNGLYFAATENLLERAKNKIGKIYVLDKTRFKEKEPDGPEYISQEEIKPLEIIEVTYDDLPNNIRIIESNE